MPISDDTTCHNIVETVYQGLTQSISTVVLLSEKKTNAKDIQIIMTVD